jgi:pantothenate kinase
MLLDERWWVEVPEDDAKRRLVKRHVTSGVTKNMEEAIWRADENDMPSRFRVSRSFGCRTAEMLPRKDGRFIVQNLLEPTRVIQSIDDSTDI